jgi:hypothetical protein
MNSFKIKYTFLSLLIFVALLVSSCQKANRLDCIKRSGSITTENRVLGSFSIIEVYDNVQVFLIQDTSNFILIKAGENLLSNIATSIEGQTLVIKNKNKCNFTRSYKYQIEIYIHFKKLDELIYRGTGPITSLNTLVNDTFTFNSWDGTDSVKLNLEVPLVKANIHTGVADLFVKGFAHQLYAYARNSGSFRMQEFICENVYTNNQSSSDSYFNVKNQLEALVQYVGNTYYIGNPNQIIKKESNKGKLIKLQ